MRRNGRADETEAKAGENASGFGDSFSDLSPSARSYDVVSRIR